VKEKEQEQEQEKKEKETETETEKEKETETETETEKEKEKEKEKNSCVTADFSNAVTKGWYMDHILEQKTEIATGNKKTITFISFNSKQVLSITF